MIQRCHKLCNAAQRCTTWSSNVILSPTLHRCTWAPGALTHCVLVTPYGDISLVCSLTMKHTRVVSLNARGETRGAFSWHHSSVSLSMNIEPSVPAFITHANLKCREYIPLCDQICMYFHENVVMSYTEIIILGLRKNTPTVKVRGETGCIPACADVKSRVLCYWYKLVNISDNSRICKVMYDLMLKMYVVGSCKHHWIDLIKTTLDRL